MTATTDPYVTGPVQRDAVHAVLREPAPVPHAAFLIGNAQEYTSLLLTLVQRVDDLQGQADKGDVFAIAELAVMRTLLVRLRSS